MLFVLRLDDNIYITCRISAAKRSHIYKPQDGSDTNLSQTPKEYQQQNHLNYDGNREEMDTTSTAQYLEMKKTIEDLESKLSTSTRELIEMRERIYALEKRLDQSANLKDNFEDETKVELASSSVQKSFPILWGGPIMPSDDQNLWCGFIFTLFALSCHPALLTYIFTLGAGWKIFSAV